ncbi:MAG: hypothetical protein RLZZ55_1503 [Bacteroidota bacterium]|jgi:hypothetical protein
MIDELKAQIEKSFGQKILSRGAAEALSQDIYLKTNSLVSYNTIRRLFGLVTYTKPRQSTLDYLAKYCSFDSYVDFCRQFPSIDSWPKWEGLFLSLSTLSISEIIIHLKKRKREHLDFAIGFALAAKELIVQNRQDDVVRLFQEPDFQFAKLRFDDVSQIGVIIGLHFRNHSNYELEHALLREENFRDLVLKSNVDYTQFNAKYGEWLDYLMRLDNLDNETSDFIHALNCFRCLLNEKPLSNAILKNIPDLSEHQHPILFGRIFSLKMILSKNKKQVQHWVKLMDQRLQNEPQFQIELLYVPAIQSLLTQNHYLTEYTYKTLIKQAVAEQWYQISLISIEQMFLASRAIRAYDFETATKLIASNPIEQIRFGYKTLMDLFITFFRIEIAKFQNEDTQILEQQFESKRNQVNLPLLSESYFQNYFKV